MKTKCFYIYFLAFVLLFLGMNTVVVSQFDFSGGFIDARDGQGYSWYLMDDGQYWMTGNMNHQPGQGSSWCYEHEAESCNSYGRLYDWNTAQSICPEGWRLPLKADFEQLIASYGEDGGEAYQMFAFGDISGFIDQNGGFYNAASQSFFYLNTVGTYWSQSSEEDGTAWEMLINNEAQEVILLNSLGAGGKSVRCIQE